MKKTIPVLISDIINGLPEGMENLGTSIEDSYIHISSLSDNWDDEGAVAPDAETLIATFTFLSKVALFVHRKTKKVISFPDVHPFSDGSIDLYWKTMDLDLLINIENDSPYAFTYCGQSKSAGKVVVDVQGGGSIDNLEREDFMNIFM